MTERRIRLIASTATIFVLLGICLSVLRPLKEPRWKRHLEQYGGEFHPIPGKPHLSVCYVELRFDYGPQTVLKPALFIRNERWTASISQLTLDSAKSKSPGSKCTLVPTSACSPVDWDSLRAVGPTGIRVGRHAYTLVLCTPPKSDILTTQLKLPITNTPSINLELVIDSESIAIDDISVVQIDPAMIGLTPVVFDAAPSYDAANSAVIPSLAYNRDPNAE